MKIVKENEEENLDYVEKAKTYVYIKIGLTIPINPLLPDIDLPNPDDYMRKEKQPPKPYTVEPKGDDVLDQFFRQITPDLEWIQQIMIKI